MRLDLVRSGGFAGLERAASVKMEDLPEQQRQELSKLVERIDLADLERRSPLRGPGADRFQYDLTVAGERGERRITADAGEGPPELRTLFERLLEVGGAP